MTFKSKCKRFFVGSWTSSRLMSRKWWSLLLGIAVIVALSIVAVSVLKVYESSIIEQAFTAIEGIVIGYLGTNVLQHGIETYERVRTTSTTSEGSDDI